MKPLISICHRKTLSLPKKVGQGQRFLCVGKQHPDGAGEGTVGRGERDHMGSGLGVVHQKGACAFRRNVEGVRRLPLRIPNTVILVLVFIFHFGAKEDRKDTPLVGPILHRSHKMYDPDKKHSLGVRLSLNKQEASDSVKFCSGRSQEGQRTEAPENKKQGILTARIHFNLPLRGCGCVVMVCSKVCAMCSGGPNARKRAS